MAPNDYTFGSSGADSFSSSAFTEELLEVVFFALGGDDTLTATVGADAPVFVGGAGNDRYVGNSGAFLIVADAVGGNDTLSLSTLPAVTGSGYALTIDNGRHLMLFDLAGSRGAMVLNWTDPDWRVESFEMLGATLTAGEIASRLGTSANFLGDFTLEQLSAELGDPNLSPAVIEAGIAEIIRLANGQSSGPSDGDDTLLGSADIDTVAGALGDDVMRLGNGDDSGWGQDGADLLDGEAGDDRLFGNRGADTLMGGAGRDTIRGHLDDDSLAGGDDADLLYGGGNDDDVSGESGNDVVNGNSGTDTVSGGAGNDTVRGQGGPDRLEGGDGDDLLLGMQGFDTLDGGADNDTLIGAQANDTLTGGRGVDVFVFAADHGTNTITDFEDGTDVISLVGIASLSEVDISDGPGGATLSFLGTTVTLTGIAASQLTAADFFLT